MRKKKEKYINSKLKQLLVICYLIVIFEIFSN